MRSDKLRAGGSDVGVWNLKVRFMARKCVVVLGVCVCMFVEQTGTMAGISDAFCVCSGLLTHARRAGVIVVGLCVCVCVCVCDINTS